MAKHLKTLRSTKHSKKIFWQHLKCLTAQKFIASIPRTVKNYTDYNYADRYVHRRELRLVSLESLLGVEYGINFFFDFRF